MQLKVIKRNESLKWKLFFKRLFRKTRVNMSLGHFTHRMARCRCLISAGSSACFLIRQVFACRLFATLSEYQCDSGIKSTAPILAWWYPQFHITKEVWLEFSLSWWLAYLKMIIILLFVLNSGSFNNIILMLWLVHISSIHPSIF